jgi:serine/threonine protein kinase
MAANEERVQEIFLAAIEVADPTERSALLNRECATDPELRQRVEKLLRADQEPASILKEPVAGISNALPSDDTIGLEPTPDSPPSSLTHADFGSKRDDDLLTFLSPSTQSGSLGRLGHYEVQEVVGKGGFGIVLRAFDEKLHRAVAIKVLAPSYAAIGSARARFIREARTAAAIRNEHVVAIHAVEDDAQPPFLVMEIIDGISLQDKLDKKGPLPLNEILRISLQTAEGLAAAHKHGFMHRDIKPANILLENGVERVKITDFGLARAVDDASVTQSGTVAGTPMYMSPEQAEGLPVDHRSDLFSLGTVLYAMSTGHPPFRASGTHAVLKRVIDASPRPIREINNEVPDWLSDIIAKLHAKKPDDRFQTAQEVADLLQQHLAHLQQPAQFAMPTRVELPKPSEPEQRSRSQLALVPLVAFLVLAAFIAGSYVFSDATRLYMLDMGELRVDDFHPEFSNFILTGDTSPEFVAGVPLPPHVPLFLEPGTYRIQAVGSNQEKVESWDVKGSRLWSSYVTQQNREVCVVEIRRGERISLSIAEWKARSAEPGWVQLFNGKDLTGWQPSDKWRVKDGILVGTGPGFLISQRTYHDFHCRLKFKPNAAAAASISFRGKSFETHGEIALGNKLDLGMKAGSFHFFSKAKSEWAAKWTQEHGDAGNWLELDLIVQGKKVHAKVNGTTTASLAYNELLEEGLISLNAYEAGTILEFSKIEIKELPPEPTEWVQLFNGKDLTGWKTHPRKPGGWQVEGSHLVGRCDKDAICLFSQRGDFADFHLKLEAKINSAGEAEVFLRSDFALDRHGVPTEDHDASVEGITPGKHIRADDWFTLDVIAKGRHYVVKINSVKVQEYDVDEKQSHRKGHLLLATLALTGPTVFHIRKIEIKELPPEEPGWMQLFNGKDLTGWNVGSKVAWQVRDGILVAKGKVDPKDPKTGIGPQEHEKYVLWTGKDYENYELRLKYRFTAAEGPESAFVLLHASGKPGDRQHIDVGLINNQPPILSKRYGASLGRHTVDPVEAPSPGAWNDLRIRCRDKTITAFFNGKERHNASDCSPFKGRIGLYVPHDEVEFGKIEIRLPPDNAPPLAVAPFDAKNAREHQDAWARHLGVETEITNSIGKKMRLIPPGEFTMDTAAKDTAIQRPRCSASAWRWPSNVLAAVKAALRATHKKVALDEVLSDFYVAEELAGTYRGMMIALPEAEWTHLADLSDQAFVAWPSAFVWTAIRKAHVVRESRAHAERVIPERNT